MAFVLATLLAFLAPAQEKAGVEDVLKLMESKATGLKDASFEIELGGRQAMSMGALGIETRVQVVRGTGVRVHGAVPRGAGGMSFVQPGTFDFIYSADALRIIAAASDDTAGGVACANLKVAWDDPALKGFDHYFLPVGFPIRLFFDEPLLYYSMDPRFFFKLESNLAYEGRRAHGGRDCHVLSSWVTPSDLTDKLGRSPMLFTRSRKEFFVDAENGRLLGIEWEVTVKQAMGTRDREEKSTLTLEAGMFKEFAGLALPGQVVWTFDSQRGGRRARRSDEMLLHTVKELRVNVGIESEAILTGTEKDDLYADAILLGAEEYAARIEKNPKDARSHYSLGFAKSDVSFSSEMLRGMGGGVKPDPVAASAAIEKAAELAPGCEAPVLNLLGLYKKSGAADKEKALLDRIEKGELKGQRVAALAASRLNGSGQHARALKLIESVAKPVEPVRRLLAVERLFALAATGDEKGLLAAFDEEARRRATGPETLMFVRDVVARAEALPDAAKKAFSVERVAELCASREGLAYRFVLAALYEKDAEPDRRVEALAALAAAAPGDGFVRGHVLDECEQMLGIAASRDMMRGLRGAEEVPAKAWGKGPAEKLAAAVTKESGARGHLVAALGLKSAGENPDEQLGKAMEACRKAAAEPEAARILFLLATTKQDEAWTGECVDLMLKLAPKAEGIPFDLLYRDDRNPVAQRLTALLGEKKHVEVFRLATRASAYLLNSWKLQQAMQATAADCADAIAAEVMKETKDPAPYRDYVDFSMRYLQYVKTSEVLEKARTLWPKDVDVLGLLAADYRRSGQTAKAAETYESMVALLDKPVAVDDRSYSKTGVLLDVAELHSAGDRAKAKETLARLELKGLDGAEAMQVGAIYARIEEPDLAIAGYLRAMEQGLKPNFQLGRLYETKKDRYEALRYYNRDMAASSSRDEAGQAAPQVAEAVEPDMETPTPAREREPRNGQEARERLLKREGTDWIIERHLETKFEALTEAESSAAKKAIEALDSEELGERDDAIEALRKIGTRVSPLLKTKLAGTGEAKDRLKKMVMEWAEPR